MFTPLVPLYKEKFFIRAKASVGASKSRVLSVVVTNCGAESVKIKDEAHPVFGNITLGF